MNPIQLPSISQLREPTLVSMHELGKLCVQALEKLGYARDDALLLTDVLLYAEQRASSQGIIKLITGGMARDPRAQPPVYEKTQFPGIAKVQGRWSHSMLCTHLASQKAMQLAEQNGIGMVAVNEIQSSSGALGYYVEKMAMKGYIALAICQTVAKVAPFGAKSPLFGTNPLAIALPQTNGIPLVLDMATSAVTWFDVLLRQQEGQQLPPEVALDPQGGLTTDPAQALKGALLAFGGAKGSGLAMMIELLAGAFVGARSNQRGAPSPNWGGLVVATRSDLFAPSSKVQQAVETLVQDVRSLEPRGGVCSVTVPGERSAALAKKREKSVPLSPEIYSQLRKMAEGT